jgi:hypothetical protein
MAQGAAAPTGYHAPERGVRPAIAPHEAEFVRGAREEDGGQGLSQQRLVRLVSGLHKSADHSTARDIRARVRRAGRQQWDPHVSDTCAHRCRDGLKVWAEMGVSSGGPKGESEAQAGF